VIINFVDLREKSQLRKTMKVHKFPSQFLHKSKSFKLTDLTNHFDRIKSLHFGLAEVSISIAQFEAFANFNYGTMEVEDDSLS
jgi:hypothetical protein